MTEYNNGKRIAPPNFKGDTGLFLQTKVGRLSTAPSEETAYVVTATPAPAAPSSSIVPTATATTITLTFSVSATATSYSYVLNGVPTVPTVDNSLGGTVTFTGLLPGTSYSLIITISGPSGSTTSAPITIYTLPIAPPVSTFQQISSPGGFTIGWAGGRGATAYTYTIRDSSGNLVTGYSVEDNSASGYSVITGLPAGQQFTITVNSVNPSGSVSSLPFSVTTAPSVPTTPPVPSSATQTSFSIPEPSIPGAIRYTYTINGNPVTPTVLGGVVTFSGLTPGQAQHLVVTAIGPNNTQTPSAPFAIYTAPLPLDPTTFTTTALNSNDITISWPHTTNPGTTSYTYILRDMSGNPVPGATVIDNGLRNGSVTVTDLPAGAQYTLTIVSNNSSGSSSSPPFTIYAPPAPSIVTETGFSIPSPSVPGAVNHIYRINGGVVAAAPAVPGFSISGGYVTFTGLPPGVRQSLVVTSVDASNNETSTPPLIVYTSPVSIPASSFTTNTSSQTAITLNWPAGSGATSYDYSITDASGNTITDAVIIDDGVRLNTATISGLLPGTQYIVTVTPRNPSGPANPTTFTANTAPPTPPQPTISAPSQTGFSMPVPSLTGATDYIYTINGVEVHPNVVNGVAIFSGLTPGVPQNLIITAVGPNNVVSSSPPYTIYTTPVTLPITNFNTSSSTSTELRIEWIGYTGATSYTYEIKDASGGGVSGAVVTDNGVASNSVKVSGLTPRTQYTVYITPINPSGIGAPMILTAYTAPPPPAPPVAVATTTTGFTFPGPSVPGANSYIYTVNNIQYTPTTDGSGNLVITGLPPGVPQVLVVTAVGDNNTESPSLPVTIYTKPVTLPPSAFNTSGSTPTELKVQWAGLTGATSYIYEIKDANGGSVSGAVITDNGVASNSIVVSGLTPGTPYTVTITARNPSGDSSPTVINGNTAPPAPSPPVASAPTQTGFTIPAPFVPGGSSYIYTINGVVVTPTISGGNAIFTGLTPGVPQVLVVTAVGPNNARTPSAPVTIYTSPVPLVVGSVTRQATPTSVTVSWPPNSTGATLYEYAVLDASSVEISGMTVVDNGVGFNSATVVGLTPGTAYYLRVTARNPSGTALPTLIPITTAPRVPALPTASAPTANGFTIDGPSSPGALSYKYTINGGFISPAPATPGYSVSGGNVVFTGLPRGVLQNLVVTAVGPNDTETPCAAISVYTLPVTLPSSAFTTRAVTSTGVTLEWTGLTGAISYIYVLKDAGGGGVSGAVITDNGVASNSIVVTGLAPGTAYTVTVTARNPSGDSTPTVVNIYTSPATPPQPVPSAPTQTGFTIPAPSVPGALSYIYMVNGVVVTPTVSGGSLVFTGLTPGVPQILVIKAVGPNNIETSSTPLTVYTTPVAVSGGSVTIQPSSNGGTFRWPSGTGATLYEYAVVDASENPITGASVTDNGISSNSATVVGVPPGTAYRLKVIARNPSGVTLPTSITAYTAPSVPSTPVPSSPTQNGFSIAAPSGAGTLSYIYTINGITVTPTVANGVVTFSGLAGGVIQRLIVTAVGPNNLRASSVPVEVLTTPVSLPSSAFSTPSSTPNGVTIRWSGTTGATSYGYTIAEANGSPVTGFRVIDNGVSSNIATLTGLAPGKQYTVSVTARNASGDSTPTSFTSYTAPAAQAICRAIAATTTGFTISVPSAVGALSYIYAVNGVTLTPAVSGDTLVFTGLTPGVIQRLVITSVGLNNLQTPSTAFAIYTKPVSLPLSAFLTIGSSPSGFTVQWTGATGATGYSYTITDGSGGPVPSATVTDNGLASKSVSFGGLSVGIGYRVTMTSINPADSVASATYIGYTGPSPPYSFATTSPSQSGFTVSWLGGIGATRYTYQMNGADVTPAQDNGMTAKNAVFTGLATGETYIIDVTARDNFGSSSTRRYVAYTIPVIPTAVIAAAATQTGFTVSWTGGKGATSYIYSLNGAITTPSIDDGVLGKTATFSGLSPGTNYYPVVVIAKNDSGQLSSAGYNQYTLTAAPTNLGSSAITSKGFTISWTAPIGADSYTFMLNGVERLPSTSTSTSATFTGLTPGTLYTVIVNADNPAPGVTPSDPLPITTTVAPSQPVIDASSVPDADITSGGLKIILPSITGGTTPISFTYSVLDGSGNSRNVLSSVLNGIATLTGLLPNTAYTVSVRAVDAVGTTSVASTPYAFTTLAGAQQPISLANSPPTLFTITVSWSLDSLGTVPVQYKYTLNNVLTSGSSSTSSPTTFSGLDMGTQYTIIVIAVDQYDSVTPSSPLTVRTLQSLPIAPANLACPTVGNTTALITWTDGDYATSFNFVVTSITTGSIVTPTISTYLTNGNLSVNSAQISGLFAGFTYSVTIQSVNSFGTSSVSGALSFTTTALVTTFASGLVGPTAITSDGVNLYVAQAPSSFSQDTADNIMKIDSGGNVTAIVSGVAKATVYNAGKTAITTKGGVFGITYCAARSPPLIFTDYGNRVIKACEADGTGIITILGSGIQGNTNGTGTAATFGFPNVCASDSSGNLYISDATYNTTRMATLANVTTSIGAFGGALSYSTDTLNDIMWFTGSVVNKNKLSSPYTFYQYYTSDSSSYTMKGITMDMYGNIIVADTTKNQIRLIYTYGRSITYNGVTLTASLATGVNADTANNNIIYAGSGVAGLTNDTLMNSTFNAPWAVQLSTDNTILYVVDNGNGAVRAMPYVIYTIISSLPPTTPTNVVQIAGPSYQLGIGWTGGFAATSYTYLIKDASNNTVYSSSGTSTATLVTDSVANKTALFSGLTYGQTYTVTVTAVNVNGPVSSTETSVTFIPYTYILATGLTTPTGIAVDNSNNIYVCHNSGKLAMFTPSGVKTILSFNAVTCENNGFYYSPLLDIFYIDSNQGSIYSFKSSGEFKIIKSGGKLAGCNKLGYYYQYYLSSTTETTETRDFTTNTFTLTTYLPNKLDIYDTSNILIGTVAKMNRKYYVKPPVGIWWPMAYGIPTTTTAIITVDSANDVWTIGISYSRPVNCINRIDNLQNVIYTYEDDVALTTNAVSMFFDDYLNLVVVSSNKIQILYLSQQPFTYKGTTYTYGQVIPYASTSSVTTAVAGPISSSVNSFWKNAKLDNTKSILYLTDANSNLITMPYIITNLPPLKPYGFYIGKNSSETQLEIIWLGGGSPTYTFSISDPNISIMTNNTPLITSIILSGSYVTSPRFDITVTATNAYGTVPSDPCTIIWPVYVSTFATSPASPMTLSFDNNNTLYCRGSTISSFDSNGTATAISSSAYTGMCYNPLLNALVVTKSGSIGYIPFTYNGTFTSISAIASAGVCRTDNGGTIYTIDGTNLIKFIPTPFSSPQTFRKVVIGPAPPACIDITIDPFGNIWASDSGGVIRQYDSSLTLMNTYTGISWPRGITSDMNGNIIVSNYSQTSYYNHTIHIICKQSTPIIYNGVSYPSESIFTYAGTGSNGLVNSQALLSTFTNIYDVKLDNTGKILYVADTGNVKIRKMAYILYSEPRPAPSQPVPTIYNILPSSLIIEWSGAFGASSYTYTLIDSNNNVLYSVSNDTSLTYKFINLSGTFSAGTNYIFTITASNAFGNSTPGTVSTGIIPGFVTDYKTGISDPRQIAIGPSNTLYVAETGANLIKSITMDLTVTRMTTTSFLYPAGICYNFKLNKLMITDSETGNTGRVSMLALTGGTPTFPKATAAGGYISGCASDNSGNTYFIHGASSNVTKLSGTTYSSPNLITVRGFGITVDPFGNIWVCNTGTLPYGIHKYDSTGNFVTSYNEFNSPRGVCSDLLGNIIVADWGTNQIKIIYTNPTPITVYGVTYTAGNVYTYAGSGAAGNESASLSFAKFNKPWCPQLNITNTVLYVSDASNNSIRAMPYTLNTAPRSIEEIYAITPITLNSPTSLTSSGFTLSWTPGATTNVYTYAFSTSAGPLTPTVIDNGSTGNNIVVSGLTQGTEYTVTITYGNSFISSTLSSSTTITTPYNQGVTNYRGYTATTSYNTSITIDTYNNIYFNTREISSNTYTVHTYFSGMTWSYPLMSSIGNQAFNSTIVIYGVCCYNNVVYACYADGNIGQTIGQTSSIGPLGSGTANSTLFATIPSPDYGIYICNDPVNPGSFYVSTNLGAIYKIDSGGSVTLFANATTLGLVTATSNKAIAADNAGNVYYIKNSNTSLMKIDQSATVSTVISGVSGSGMKFTSDYSTLYIAYTSANKIMKYVVSTNTLTTFAGSGTAGSTNTTNLLTSTFNQPYDLAIDSSGHFIYVVDYANKLVRTITFN